jgi:molecular chaperone GrpE
VPDDHPYADLAERLDDLTRALTRQAATLDRMADEARAREAKERAGADLPLLVDLLALHGDAAACAATARTRRERDAFTAVAAGLARLIAGRGGELVVPAAGAEFDPASMDATEVRPTDDAGLDRLVAAVLAPGLRLTALGRTVRPARVAVHRHRST